MRIANQLRATALGLTALAGLVWPTAGQHEPMSSHSRGHTPIGVAGDHVLGRGTTMVSYRYMRMSMSGNRTGTTDLSTDDVLKSFMAAPESMTMTMHMAGVMIAPSDAVTLMAMANWTSKSMNNATRQGHAFQVESSGIGDVGIAALVRLKGSGSVRAHLNLGATVPAGSIEKVGETPTSMGQDVQLPYPMQLGSGTWDLMPGVTVLGTTRRMSWGAQGKATFRVGQNSRQYRMGHGSQGTAWVAFLPSDYVSFSARVLASKRGSYDGSDEGLNPKMTPAARADLRGGQRLDLPVGVNVYFPEGTLQGHRLAAELSLPVYQDLVGPQLKTGWQLTIGWQKSFAPAGHH